MNRERPSKGDEGLDDILREGGPRRTTRLVQATPGGRHDDGAAVPHSGRAVTPGRTAGVRPSITAPRGSDLSGIELGELHTADRVRSGRQTVTRTPGRTREAATAGVEPDGLVNVSPSKMRPSRHDLAGHHRRSMGPPTFGHSRDTTTMLPDTIDACGTPKDAARGGRVALPAPEKRPESFLGRCGGLGTELRSHGCEGRLTAFDHRSDAVTPGEFSQTAHTEAEADDLGTVAIASRTDCIAAPSDEAQARFDVQSLAEFLIQSGGPTVGEARSPA